MNDADIAELRLASQEKRDRWGLDIEWLDRQALRAEAPWLGADVQAATVCQLDAVCSPLTAGNALISAASRAGVKIVANAAVERIGFDGHGYHVETARGAHNAATVVVTAGPWSSALTRMLGTPLPTYVDIDMLTVTEPCPRSWTAWSPMRAA